MNCPECKIGIVQMTKLTPPDSGLALGCNKCSWPTCLQDFFIDLPAEFALTEDELWNLYETS